MTAVVLAVLAVGCLVGTAVALRRVGPAYRIGRLLAGTQAVELAEAIELASARTSRYVRVSGRVSSDEEFPDEHDRPLVYRRSRIDVADGRGRWQPIAQDREAVPFGIELRGHFVAVEPADLAEGLVVVPREALGRVSDLDPETAAGHPPDAPSRLVIEQVSAVEQATVAGVPQRGPTGEPVMRAGLGRPLILTTLDVPAAMRVLAADRRRLVVVAAVLLAAAAALGLAALVALVANL